MNTELNAREINRLVSRLHFVLNFAWAYIAIMVYLWVQKTF